MPPFLANIMANRQLMIGIIAGLVGLILTIFLLVLHPWSGSAGSGGDVGNQPIPDSQLPLASVDSIGKAIEIQALLARQGIQLDRGAEEGGKIPLLFEKGAKMNDRDKALITLVQSGLMDRNIGLEAFDKGDLTASREEKRIKLIRAQQGELARLIRKIAPIEDASVDLSIPEPSIFRSSQKPMSASVQLTLPTGERLTRDKVRSIINLIVGSVEGLDAEHVALADTNGNTYNSVIQGTSELNDKLEEQDQYMKQKVSAQLDRLIGQGHYVVTVSTLLREAPKETMTQVFDPERSVVANKQNFTERLNAQAGQAGIPGGPTSSFVPKELHATFMGESNSSKGYIRDGTEVTYANAKTQTVESSVPGMLEDISVAVTVDSSYFPKRVSEEQLKTLIAFAASPKVNPENVSIAQTDFQKPNIIPVTNTLPVQSDTDTSWIYWAVGSVVAVFITIVLVSVFSRSGGQKQLRQTQDEIAELRNLAHQQQLQIRATQEQAQMMLENQSRQQYEPYSAIAPMQNQYPQAQVEQLKQALSEIQETARQELGDEKEEALGSQIKSWIESSS